MRGLLLSLPLVLLVAGCSDSGTTGAANENQDAKVEDERPATVFDPMVETMDRAAAVEELSTSRKGELDAAIDGSD